VKERSLPRSLAILSGVLFAAGLALSGMTQPAKVIGFLDVGGNWDPSLAFVMAGAVGVFAVAYRGLAVKLQQPLFADRFSLPKRADVDASLLGGAAIFGVGWGSSGFCPGPSLVAFGAGVRSALWFVPAVVAGMAVHQALGRSRGGPAGGFGPRP
jgi:uncharacterized membrane protein YedE/YeeE